MPDLEPGRRPYATVAERSSSEEEEGIRMTEAPESAGKLREAWRWWPSVAAAARVGLLLLLPAICGGEGTDCCCCCCCCWSDALEEFFESDVACTPSIGLVPFARLACALRAAASSGKE